jgi:ribosomal protein L11 methyltransferase
VSGVQELPASQDLYIPQKGSEFREPQHPTDWTKDEKLIEEAQTRLKIFVDNDSQKIEKIKNFFIENSLALIEEILVNEEAYFESYKQSVQGKSFGEGFWIGPPWATHNSSQNEKSILIDPGMAFGTGEHPTTQMCVESIWEFKNKKPQHVLDIGAGSGILAIAWALWIPQAQIVATDFDPHSDDEIKKNLELNSLPESKVQRLIGDKAQLSELIDQNLKFDLIVSNIYGEVLAQLAPAIYKLLAPQGTWMATGVLDGPSREIFEASLSKVDSPFKIQKQKERHDAPPNDSHLWLCYELQRTST